ncbi:MAG: NERD domain-containing protein [Methyloversatilis sp.]|uniref:nuclease-related domain-containing protein n=1 Tax=Methyloversatilis sp. TaxID=2569862 RepID=UPI001A511044|nr:nuclease-related domain-containing protein [Methyloversatilis sp.]MBL8475989.1 NERD domain-containing protein [Methyloversatilis sp.]
MDLMLELVRALGLVVVMLIGPAVALGFLLLRKRQVRKRSRTPLTDDLLRPPGHSLLKQIESCRDDIDEHLMRLMLVPTVFTAFYFVKVYSDGATGLRAGLASLVALVVLGFMVHSVATMLKTAKKLDALKAGYDAELAVAQELDQLMRKGAWVFHDVEGKGFNIDHVVVAPQGVFAVETKGYTKRTGGDGKVNARVVFDGLKLVFPHHSSTDPIEQAVRQAKWLSDWLGKATGAPVTAVPVVALPGWYVERKGAGAVSVFSGKELQAHLLTIRRAQAVTDSHMRQIAHQLDQRCRNIKPQYVQ